MDPALTNLVVGSLLTLFVTLVTTWSNSYLAANREERAETRKRRQDKISGLQQTYEDVLFSLETFSVKAYISPRLLDNDAIFAQMNDFSRFYSRLHLVSTSEIAEKYKSTSLALEDLRRSDRAPRDEQANPKEQGQQKDESLKIYMKGYGELRDMMRKHLDSLHV